MKLVLFVGLSTVGFLLGVANVADGLEEAEMMTLNKVIVEINYLEELVKEAKRNQNPSSRVQFDYSQLLLDLDRVRDGVADHLDKPWINQREIRDIEEIVGNYGAQQ